MPPSLPAMSPGHRLFVERIRQQLKAQGRAHMKDLGKEAAEQIRVLQSLDVVERIGDEVRFVPQFVDR